MTGTFDTSKLKTFEDALDAIDEIDWRNDNANNDAHMIAEWMWNNCDHNDIDVLNEVYLWSDEDSELEWLAYTAHHG